jgi:hypothetical protein
VNDKSEETSKPIDEQGVTHILNLPDPARGDDANEFQGRHCNANVSFIVVDAPPRYQRVRCSRATGAPKHSPETNWACANVLQPEGYMPVRSGQVAASKLTKQLQNSGITGRIRTG